MEGVTIETPRFILRSLTEGDASERYLSWLVDSSVSRFIVSARPNLRLDDLRAFIAERLPRRDVLFLGIFLRDGITHIGNIKYEPVNQPKGYAVMGLLIGEQHWRDKGIAQEVLKASIDWLAREANIGSVFLGVDRENLSAINAYTKYGFKLLERDELGIASERNLAMVYRTGGNRP
ncbi:GNAT family N-acetyltransferase [Candidatus Kaiserbacteria bacterium]|nr:GNAT family N-acetyltransferase [Candidatus Kaiserbacteria bacterium]